ncbi:MAG: CHAT domain-containing protein, partial [Cyanobacteria bacterium P01_H01_bin.130]
DVDTGTTEVDTGTTEVDTGTTAVDTGTTEIDTGTTDLEVETLSIGDESQEIRTTLSQSTGSADTSSDIPNDDAQGGNDVEVALLADPSDETQILVVEGDDPPDETLESVELDPGSFSGDSSVFLSAWVDPGSRVSRGNNVDVDDFRRDLGDRIEEVTPGEFIGYVEHLRAAEYGNYWGVSYQVPVVESSLNAIQNVLRVTNENTDTVSAVLYTFAYEDRLELALVLPTGAPLRHTVENVSLAELRRTTAQLRRRLTSRVFGSLPTYLPSAQRLYRWIIAPFRQALEEEEVDVLQFSLDPGLRSLPMAMLHDGEQFLIENFAVATIPSFALLDTNYQPLQNSTVLAAGTAEFETLPRLPAVPVEVEAIDKAWETVALLDQEFTLAGIQAARRDANVAIAHLATHAFFQPGDPDQSYVQLWGTERIDLDAIAAFNFHSPPLGLLVLSACRTAVGDDSAELGFAGLSIQSGARSVVASLWQVSDSGTLALMAEFYDALADLPTKAEALRQAQLGMLRGKVTIEQGQLRGISRGTLPLPEAIGGNPLDFTHPYFWSGFTLVGAPW